MLKICKKKKKNRAVQTETTCRDDLENKKGLEQNAAQQNRSPTSGYYMRGTSNINKTSTTSSWILKGPLTGSGTQRYVQLYNTNANLINIIQQLYDRTSNAVYHDDRLGDWFRTTVGVRQGCLLSPTLFFQHLLIRKKS